MINYKSNKMEGEIIMILVFIPIAVIVCVYRLLNRGEYPCVNSNATIFNYSGENV